jgi:hypothetical protein
MESFPHTETKHLREQPATRATQKRQNRQPQLG